MASPAFIGRERELSTVIEILDAAAEPDTPSLVLIRGEAGIGKSRLLDVVGSHAATSTGMRVLRGAFLPTQTGLPYAAVADALDRLEDQVGTAGLRRLAGRWWHEVAGFCGIDDPAQTTADRAGRDPQLRLFQAVAHTIVAATHQQPVMLGVEDLHWADASTLDLLTFLVHHVVGRPVVTLATVRDEDVVRDGPVAEFLAVAIRARVGIEIDLPRLDRQETAALATAIWGGEISDGELTRLVELTGGNPLLVEEVLAADAAGTSVTRLHGLLLQRMARLGPAACHVVQAAAVAGRPCDQSRLLRVAARTRDDPTGDTAASGLREALHRGALVLDTAHRVRFRHALMREAVEQELLAPERARLHAAWGEVLEEAVGGEPAELAHHWTAAKRPERALPAAWQAMQAAERLPAFAETSHHAAQVLDLWDRAPGAAADLGVDRSEVLERAASAAEAANQVEHAATWYREAIACLDDGQDPRHVGLLYSRLGRMALFSRSDDAVPAARTSCDLVPASPPTVERVEVLARAAFVLLLSGHQDAADLARKALAAARDTGDERAEALALTIAGPALTHQGHQDADAGAAMLRRARALAHRTGDWETELRACGNLAGTLLRAGRLHGALEASRSQMDIAAAAGPQAGHWLVSTQAVEAALLAGRWGEADRVLAHWSWPTEGTDAYFQRIVSALLELHRGDLDHPLQVGRQIDDEFAARPAPQCLQYLVALRGGAELWAGNPTAVLAAVWRWLRATDDLGDTDPLPVVLQTGLRACADVGDQPSRRRDPASIDTRERLAHRLEESLPGPCRLDQVRLEAARAELARARHDPDARTAWQTTVGAWEGIGAPYEAAYARWRLAEAMLAGGVPRTEVTDVLRPAAATTARLGARPLAGEIAALATRARLDLAIDVTDPGEQEPDPSPLADLGLTGREQEVLALLAEGLTNRQIGDRLYMSASTAGVHVSHILHKLGVSNRVAAAGIAHRLDREPT